MRIGLHLDGPLLPAWQRAVAHALGRAGAEVALVLHDEGRAPAAPAPDPLASLAWPIVERLDRWLADRRERTRGIEEATPIADALPGVACHALPAAPPARVERARAALEGLDLLVSVDPAAGPLAAEALPAGVRHWVVSLSAHDLGAAVPRGFWEAARGEDVIEISVRDARNGRVLRRRMVGADPLTWTGQRRMAAMLVGPMLVDALAREGTDATAAGDRPPARSAPTPEFDEGARLGPPGSSAVLAAMRRKLAWAGAELLSRRKVQRWHIRIGRADGSTPRLRDFEPVVAPAGSIWADPFPRVVMGRDGQPELVIFAEELRDEVGRGTIVLLRRESGVWAATPILEAPHHLSYPFLFEWEGERYMIPEAGRGNSIPLLRMGSSVTEWEPLPPLMTGEPAVDTSLLAHDGRIWLFTSFSRHPDFGAHYRELHLFHATRFPTTEWIPHPANPIVCDARIARMGGGFLRRGDALYRVAQGARVGLYGTSIELRRITRLDPEGYAEEPAGHIGCGFAPGLTGVHHLVEADGWIAIDARQEVRR